MLARVPEDEKMRARISVPVRRFPLESDRYKTFREQSLMCSAVSPVDQMTRMGSMAGEITRICNIIPGRFVDREADQKCAGMKGISQREPVPNGDKPQKMLCFAFAKLFVPGQKQPTAQHPSFLRGIENRAGAVINDGFAG